MAEFGLWFGDFVTKYGYFAVFLGSLVEGESIILTASACCACGLLDIRYVFLISFLGTTFADQVLFYLGTRYSDTLRKSKYNLLHRYDKLIMRLLASYPKSLLLTFRFVPGIRTPTPIIVGMHLFPARQFCVLNIIAAGIWAVISCSAGYFFGLQLLHAAYFVGGGLVLAYGYLAYLVHKKLHQHSEDGQHVPHIKA